MRCPNCCRFVSMETPEPEEDDFDFEITEKYRGLVQKEAQRRAEKESAKNV